MNDINQTKPAEESGILCVVRAVGEDTGWVNAEDYGCTSVQHIIAGADNPIVARGRSFKAVFVTVLAESDFHVYRSTLEFALSSSGGTIVYESAPTRRSRRYHVRFNTQHASNPNPLLVWRIFEDGVERCLASKILITSPVSGMETEENGVKKWNICTNGVLNVVERAQRIEGVPVFNVIAIIEPHARPGEAWGRGLQDTMNSLGLVP